MAAEVRGNENILPKGYDTWETFPLGTVANLKTHSLVTTKEVTTERSMSGKAFKLNGQSTDNYVYLGDKDTTDDYFIPVVNGERYIFSFYYYSSDISKLQMYVRGSHGNHNYRGQVTYSNLNTWQRYAWDFIADSDYITVRFDLDTGYVDGFFDNLMLERAYPGQINPSEFKGFNEISLKVDWQPTDFYNAEDLNRVEKATDIVRERLSKFRNMTIVLNIVNNRTEKTIEFADSLNRIESNIKELITIFGHLENTLDIMRTDWTYNSPFNFNDAIRLERNLDIMYKFIVENEANIPFCGQYIAGQEGVY